ncbi:MAG: GTP 3',8-cyclase MoaA [Candidatus Bathyarchaeia archaeon]
MVLDRYGRPLMNLRVSVTESCNLECFYCHREGQFLAQSLMTPDEVKRIVQISCELGVENVKITGGEPLLRRDLEEIVSGLKGLKALREISMVSNGRLLSAERSERLKKAGLNRVNINLPSLNPDTYMKMTGGSLEDALNGVRNAVEAGLTPVKLNMVLMKGLNDGEMWAAVDFAEKAGAVLQLIELEPVGLAPEVFERFHVPLEGFEEALNASAESMRVRKWMQNRKVYSLRGVDVEIVKPIENTEFCAHCTRLRVTCDGKLKPCLMRNDNLVDILTPLRRGASDEELKELFLKAVELREPYWRG